MIYFNKVLTFCVLFVSFLFCSISARPFGHDTLAESDEIDFNVDDLDSGGIWMNDLESDEDVLNPEFSNEADPEGPIENDVSEDDAKEMLDDTNIDEDVDEHKDAKEIDDAFVEEETKRIIDELASEEKEDDIDIEEDEEDNIEEDEEDNIEKDEEDSIEEDEEDNIEEDEEDNIEEDEEKNRIDPIIPPDSWYDRFKHYITKMGK